MRTLCYVGVVKLSFEAVLFAYIAHTMNASYWVLTVLSIACIVLLGVLNRIAK
ncbi:hypothetical protein [Bacillus sp. 0102A]|uniref:hypothetical protein n=1 Tax=Bacillus sp. 0102A TaxID=3120563 RepID=UPI002FDA1C88